MFFVFVLRYFQDEGWRSLRHVAAIIRVDRLGGENQNYRVKKKQNVIGLDLGKV